MSETTRFVPAGISRPEQAVGLTGLVPFEILTLPPVEVRAAPGSLRVWLDLPPDFALHAAEPIQHRVFGGEAGLQFERGGQILKSNPSGMPLELPYQPRPWPAPPASGQLVLDLSFTYVRPDSSRGTQDVQWRQPVVWNDRGRDTIEQRFTLKA